jgi:hypothetical protein
VDGWPVCEVWVDRWAEGEDKGERPESTGSKKG